MGSNHRRARLQRAALPLSYLCEMERPVGNRTHRPHVGNVVLYH